MRIREGDKDTAIIEAAVAVFGEKGFFESKMNHIAEKAGVGTGTVYLYFKNKEAVLERIVEQTWESLAEQIEETGNRSDIDAAAKISAIISRTFAYFADYPLLAKVFVNDEQHLARICGIHTERKARDRALAAGKSIVQQGQAEGTFSTAIDAALCRDFFFGGLRHILLQWAAAPDAQPLEDLQGNLSLFILSGLRIR